MIYAGDFNAGFHRAFTPGADAALRGVLRLRQHQQDQARSTPSINSGHTFSTTPKFSGEYVDHVFVSKEFQVAGVEAARTQ